MSSMGKAATGQSMVRKYRVIIIGIAVLSTAAVMYMISSTFLTAMHLCNDGGVESSLFVPNTVVTATCPVVRDLGQDLTFSAHFSQNFQPIKIPAHLEIRDPNNAVMYDMDFDDRITVSFKPELYGNYVATITSLEDEDNRTHGGDTYMVYAFGFLLEDNPLGNALVIMRFILSYPLGIAGAIIVGYGIITVIRKRKTEDKTQ